MNHYRALGPMKTLPGLLPSSNADWSITHYYSDATTTDKGLFSKDI